MAINFNKYRTEGEEFLSAVANELNIENKEEAGRILRSVLHGMRNRITVEENMHLVSQLPLPIKGVYVDNWDVGATPKKFETIDEFAEEVKHRDMRAAEHDFKDTEDVKNKTRSVLKVVRQYVAGGELDHVKGMMPEELKELFSNHQ